MVDITTTSRRGLLGGAMAVGGLAATQQRALAAPTPRRGRGQRSMIGVPFEVHDTVRIGLIGLGNRGMGMLGGWLAVPGAVVTAVCDIRNDRAARG